MSEFKLIKEIIELSESDTWDLAKKEWKLIEIIESDEPETCLCGHFPIKELCELKNSENGNITTVGNSCVKKFMGISSDKIFGSIKKIRKDILKSINIETLIFLYNKKIISDWEKKFYENIMRKRKLTEKQIAKKIEINNKVLSIIKKRGI